MRIANNVRVNALSRTGITFRPVELEDGDTGAYSAVINGRLYAAVFNFSEQPICAVVDGARAGWPESGTVTDLERGAVWTYRSVLRIALAPRLRDTGMERIERKDRL